MYLLVKATLHHKTFQNQRQKNLQRPKKGSGRGRLERWIQTKTLRLQYGALVTFPRPKEDVVSIPVTVGSNFNQADSFFWGEDMVVEPPILGNILWDLGLMISLCTCHSGFSICCVASMRETAKCVFPMIAFQRTSRETRIWNSSLTS